MKRGQFSLFDPYRNLTSDGRWTYTWDGENRLIEMKRDTDTPVLTTGDVLKGTFEFSGGSGPKTITNAQLAAALGSETDFKLRAWFVRSGLRSLNYDEVTVRKV